ncbi:hypothetical protein C8R44DRAFT_990614 [Mycena epipterygia]|nr:hypothetical protein C8R44DRAFT_990614 [Mycena epipterygia]
MEPGQSPIHEQPAAESPPEMFAGRTLESLPIELIDIIISELTEYTVALRSCTTVCRRWLPCARHHLSQRTSFTLHYLEEFVPAERTPADQGLGALVSSPDCSILPYITHLTIDVHYRQTGLLQPSLALLPAPLLVRTLRIRHAAWDVLRVSDRVYILSTFSSITALHIRKVDCLAEELQIILGAFPMLVELSISVVAWTNAAPVDGPTTMPFNELTHTSKLQRLHIEETELYAVVSWIVTMDILPPLRYLQISISTNQKHARTPLERLLDPFATTLQQFTIGHIPHFLLAGWASRTTHCTFPLLTTLTFTSEMVDLRAIVVFFTCIDCPALQTLEIAVRCTILPPAEELERLQMLLQERKFRMLRSVRFVLTGEDWVARPEEVRAVESRIMEQYLQGHLSDAETRGILQLSH